jgi:Family of unknown function (DUF6152)
MNKPISLGCLVALVLAMALPAAAHHSYAMFDSTKQVSLAGTIREFRWTNPHSWIEIDVPNEQGGTDTWSVECGSPNDMARHGWRSSTLKPGDKATIVINPLRNGDKGGRFISVTLADGTVLAEPALRKPPATKE